MREREREIERMCARERESVCVGCVGGVRVYESVGAREESNKIYTWLA